MLISPPLAAASTEHLIIKLQTYTKLQKKLRESAPSANLIPHYDGISDNFKIINTLPQPSRNDRTKLMRGTQNRQFNTMYTTDKFIGVSKNKTE